MRELRREGAAELETYASFLRVPKREWLRRWLPWIFDERDLVHFKENRRFLFVRNNCCFVFLDEYCDAPLYVIDLDELTANREDEANLEATSLEMSPSEYKDSLITVLLKRMGRNVYHCTFDGREDQAVAQRFILLVNASVVNFKEKSYDKTSTKLAKLKS